MSDAGLDAGTAREELYSVMKRDLDFEEKAEQALDYETTYCRRTVHSEGPIALHDAEAAGWGDDPAYGAHGLDSSSANAR